MCDNRYRWKVHQGRKKRKNRCLHRGGQNEEKAILKKRKRGLKGNIEKNNDWTCQVWICERIYQKEIYHSCTNFAEGFSNNNLSKMFLYSISKWVGTLNEQNVKNVGDYVWSHLSINIFENLYNLATQYELLYGIILTWNNIFHIRLCATCLAEIYRNIFISINML